MTEQTLNTETAPVSLSVKDLADAASYIDLAFKKGAYGAEEASEISNLYKKIVVFINATIETQQKAQEANKEGNTQ